MFLSRLLGSFRPISLMALCAPAIGFAQVPGAPVLQNAFSNPGLAVAANYGGGSGQSFFGVAGGWGMGSGRLQLSAAAGAQRASNATRGAYGGRLASSLWTSSGGSLGLGAFAGLGGAAATRANGLVTNPALLIVPVGATVGYRRALGSTRGISAYVSPMYRWTRATADTSVSSGVFRFAAGMDVGVSNSLGATIGGEFGSSGASRTGGGGSAFGVAVTFVPGRR